MGINFAGKLVSIMTALEYIDVLQLLPHPEGGYYKETYRSQDIIDEGCLSQGFTGNRNISTAIYYLLQQRDFSAFHKIRSDECWQFYAGATLLVHIIDTSGNYTITKLGSNVKNGEVFQFIVPANTWFASEPAPGTIFSLVGCTVAPGFDFGDFEIANKQLLLKEYSQHQQSINRLCR